MNYEFNLNINDLVSPKLKKIQSLIHKINPFDKFNKDGKKATTQVNKISHSFKKLSGSVSQLNVQYDKNRRSIIALQRASLTASKERKREINSEIRLLRQENREIKESIKLNKRSSTSSKGIMRTPMAGMTLGKMIGPGALIGGVMAAGQGIVSSVKGANVQQQAEAQVTAGIKSTNNAAGYSLDQFKALASELQNLSTFGDEDILANVTAQLQTFTSISGTVFKDAQQSVIDMAAKTGRGLKEISTMMGKALNDPIKGVTALTRVGVQFTDAQKAQITAYQQAGDLQAAQNIMLKELQVEFGGSAEAMTQAGLGPMKQLMNTIGDIGEIIGGFVLPYINKLATVIKDFFNTNGNKIQTFFDNITSFISGIDFKAIGSSIMNVFNYIKTYGIEIFNGIKQPLLSIWDTLKTTFGSIFTLFKNVSHGFNDTGSTISKIMNTIKTYVTTAFTTFSKIFKFVGKLIQVIVVIIQKLDPLWKVIGDAISWLYDNIITPFMKGIGKFFDWMSKQLDWLLGKMGVVNGVKQSTVTVHGREVADNTADNNSFAFTGGLTSTTDNNTNLGSAVNLQTDRSIKNYTFNIQSLVDELSINTNTIQESESEIENLITRTLRKALLDVSTY